MRLSPKILVTVAVVVVLLVVFALIYYAKNPLGAKVKIRDAVFIVDLAVKPQETIKGLSGRPSLPADRGMLFVFDHPEQYSFWMKDMNFPLDIIWIEDKTIIDISKNVPNQKGYPLPTYTPSKPVNRVLEINAGLSDKYGFQIGDTVTFLKR